MKNFTLRKLLTVLFVLFATVANAYEFEVDGIYYNIYSYNTVEVTSSGNYYNRYNGSVVIPESVTYNGVTYSVASIGGGAFSSCSGLTSIEIPNSVTSIGEGAFSDCSSLTSIEIPNSVIIVESYAFYGCSSLTNLTIGSSVEDIGYETFGACSGLTSIEIPNSVTSIGNRAFWNCSGLTSVIIPNSVTSLGEGAFCDCNGLTSVKIGNGVTSIGNEVFYNCSRLTNITIPNSVTSIGNGAFQNCSGLTSVTIGNNVESIGEMAFANCYGLTGFVIPNNIRQIENQAFENCHSLKIVINSSAWLDVVAGSRTNGGVAYYADEVMLLPDVSCVIDDYVFAMVDGVNVLSKYIGNDTDLILPESCNGENYVIAEKLFEDNTAITSVVIPNSVTSIGELAFAYCYSLTSVTISNGVTSIGNGAFSSCSGLTSIEIPNSVTSIGKEAFYDCSNLASITIPSSVTSIGSGVFWNCTWLASVTFENGVTSIGEAMFRACRNLTSVTIPNSVTSIGGGAFNSCSGLTSIEIPYSVTDIAENAFYGCSNLKTVYNSSSLTFTKGSTDYGYVAYYADEIIIHKTYALKFVVNGEVLRTDNLEYGEEIVLPEMEEREGYTFDGWKILNNKIAIDIAANANRMLYSNAPCTNTMYNDQFVSWDVLFDNNVKTIFHSEYGNKQTVDGLDHYIRVDMGEGNRIGLFEFTYMTREGNDRVSPKTIVVEGSNEAFGEYTEIATLTNLPGSASTNYNSDALGDDNIKYRYIRYRVTETSAGDMDSGHPFFAISEFGMSRVCYNVPTTMPDFSFTLEGSYISNATSLISELNDNVIHYVSKPYHSVDEDAVYDLSGRTVEKPKKGLYIINGKKRFVK